MTKHLAEIADHDVFRLEVAMPHAPAVREGHRIADFLENGQQRRQRVFPRAVSPVPSFKPPITSANVTPRTNFIV